MKIQSHDILMESSSTSYRSYLESKLSFATFFTKAPVEELEEEKLQENNLLEIEKPNLTSFVQEQSRTLNELIQNLIRMLQERTGKTGLPPEEDDMMGYTHISYYERYEEHASVEVSTLGKIQTDKGIIDLNINFSMSRSFVIENQIDIYSPFDPLIVNLKGGIPDLSSDTFSFDLDNDGEADQISKLKAGNGFLALDKNNDGVINNGKELFGTLTGNGFEELREFDKDNNSWIDENDSIFDSLRIWLKDEESKEKELVALGEVGIGAIFLDATSSEYTYKTALNQTLGEMKSSSLFLFETGEVGNLSQIDLAMREKEEPLASLLQA